MQGEEKKGGTMRMYGTIDGPIDATETVTFPWGEFLLVMANTSLDATEFYAFARKEGKTIAEYTQELTQYPCNKNNPDIPEWVEELRQVLPAKDFIIPEKALRSTSRVRARARVAKLTKTDLAFLCDLRVKAD